MKSSFARLLCFLLPLYCGGWVGAAAEPGKAGSLRELAAKGDGPSQLKLALLCDEKGDSREAVRWYRKAAGKGYVQAAAELGFKYFKGIGVAQNKVEGVKWFRVAAEHGEAVAQFDLASCYLNGDGVGRNMAKAVAWCRVAAEQNHPDAEYMMGVLYGRGDGVPQDYETSYEWVSLAAAHGHRQARESLETLKGMLTSAQLVKAKTHVGGLKVKVSTGRSGP